MGRYQFLNRYDTDNNNIGLYKPNCFAMAAATQTYKHANSALCTADMVRSLQLEVRPYTEEEEEEEHTVTQNIRYR